MGEDCSPLGIGKPWQLTLSWVTVDGGWLTTLWTFVEGGWPAEIRLLHCCDGHRRKSLTNAWPEKVLSLKDRSGQWYVNFDCWLWCAIFLVFVRRIQIWGEVRANQSLKSSMWPTLDSLTYTAGSRIQMVRERLILLKRCV